MPDLTLAEAAAICGTTPDTLRREKGTTNDER